MIMPNYRGELECKLLAPGIGDVTSSTPDKVSGAMFATYDGRIIAAAAIQSTPNGSVMSANPNPEVQPFVEACRKILEAPKM
jgi:hypothetical protein